MPIDPSIALSYRPPQLDNPIEMYQRALQLKQMGNAQQLQQLQMREGAQKLDEGQQQLEATKLENAQRQRQAQGQQLYGNLLKQNVTMDDTGKLAVNHDAIEQGLLAGGYPELQAAHNKQRREIERATLDETEAQLKIAGTQTKELGKMAQSILNVQDPELRAQLWPQALKLAQTRKLITPEEMAQFPRQYDKSLEPQLQQMADMATDNPYEAHLKRIQEQRAAAEFAPKLAVLQADATKKGLDTAAQVLGAAKSQDEWDAGLKLVPKDLQDQFPKAFSPTVAAMAGQLGMTPTERSTAEAHKETMKYDWARLQETMRHNGQIEEGAELTPEAQNKMAEMFAMTGQLPSLGMGRQGAKMRSQIINLAAKDYSNVDFATNKAAFQANSQSLKQATTLKDALNSFENTALKNMKILEDSAKKIVDSGSPWINKPIRDIDEKALGNEELPVYRAARQIVVNEVAKLTSNPSLGGQLSDSARKEIEELVPASMTLSQLMKIIPTFKQDMKNRTSSVDEQLEAIKNRIKDSAPKEEKKDETGTGDAGPKPLVKPGGELEKLINKNKAQQKQSEVTQ